MIFNINCLLQSISILMLKFSPIGPKTALSAASWVPFICSCDSVGTCLTFWGNKMFETHLVLFLVQLWNQSFFQGVLAPDFLEANILMLGYLDTRFLIKFIEKTRTHSVYSLKTYKVVKRNEN